MRRGCSRLSLGHAPGPGGKLRPSFSLRKGAAEADLLLHRLKDRHGFPEWKPPSPHVLLCGGIDQVLEA